jgi:hypothetical protein
LVFWIANLFCNHFNDFGFREAHYKVPLLNLVVISSAYIHSHVKVKICQENKQVNFWDHTNYWNQEQSRLPIASLIFHTNCGIVAEINSYWVQPLIKRASVWMDYKTLFLALEMGFSFWISWWNMQNALVAGYGKRYINPDLRQI